MDLIKMAEEIISGQMQLVDFEDEIICFVSKDTDFKIIKHYHKDTFYGYNLYARLDQDLILLETYNTRQEAEAVRTDIRNGLDAGAALYKLPAN